MKNTAKKLLSIVLALTMIVPMFVLPTEAADTAPQLITSTAGYSNIEVRVTTDKDPLNYRIGDKVSFTMKVYADNVHVSVPMIKGWLEGDGSTALGVDKVSENFTLYPDENGVFTLTRNVISIPGYMRIEGNIYSADGSTKWAETPNNDRAYTLGAGILVNHEEITTVSPEPDDFDEVWADRLADLYKVEPKIVRIDKVTKYYSGSSLQDLSSVTNRDVYAVYLECPGNSGDVIMGDNIGNQAGATWAVAYITVPTDKSDGSMSFSQGYQGYGINTATPTTGTSNIGINMATHSVVLLCNENAASSDDYKNKYKDYIKGGTSYGKDEIDNSAIETCYFANLLLRDLQMLRFAKQAFGAEGAASLLTDATVINGITQSELLSEMEYWKGLYNGTISTSGGSQGGFQAIGVAALDHDVASVNASIPWMGDTHINTDQQRVQGGTRPTPGEGIRYCDTAFLAARVEAPLTILARLVDKSCVPTGVAAIWNNLAASKKDVDGYMGAITWIQSGTHGYSPTYPENQTQVIRTYEQIEPAGIANNLGGFTKSGYTDIDGYTPDQDALPPSTGYIQIGTSNKTAATVAEGFSPSFFYQGGANVYYNAELKKLVFVSTSSTISSGYGYQSATATQNSNTNGAIWHLAYWAAQNNLGIKDIEFRRGTTTATAFSGIGYVTTILTAAETIRYDEKLTGCTWGGNKDAGIVVGMTSLTSLGHGTFAADGKFTSKTYKNGVVNLTGFTAVSTSHWAYMLYNCASVTEVVTHTLAGANLFEGCSWLKKVTIPATASLNSIGANGFKGCNRLESIDIGCTVSSVSVGKNAFSGNAVVINVNGTLDKETMITALKAASITNATVVAGNETFNPVPQGIKYGELGYEESAAFSDLNKDGWIQIGGSSAQATVTKSGDMLVSPSLFRINNAKAYFNESLGKLVIVATGGSISANFGDNTSVTQANIDANKANVVGLCVANHTKIYVDNPSATTLGATGFTSIWLDSSHLKKYKPAYDAAIEAGKSVDEAKQVGGAAVAAEKYKWSKIKNSEDVGSVWEIGYWIDKNASKIVDVEVRALSNADLHSSCYFFDYMSGAKTVKLATKVTLSYNNTDVGAFYNMESLVSLGHGTFADDGSFTATTYKTGVVDITGLSSAPAGKLGYIFLNSTAITTAVVPRLDVSMFKGAVKLQSVTIPKDYTLTTIAKNVFKDCKALEYIIIEGAVDSSITIDSTAFSGTVGVTAVVQTAADKTALENALTTAGATSVTVILANEYVKEVANAIIAEGFSVRMKDYTGLRALFSFDDVVASVNEYEGFTLVSYGVIASTYARFVNDFNSDEDALFAEARKNTNKAIKYVPVYNADGTGANKYVDYATKTFCVSLTNIAPDNALSDIYMAGYAIWVDGNGNEAYTLTTYRMPDAEKAVNLYEITLGLTKNGLINSENTDDVCFWQTLKNGALRTNTFNTANNSTPKGYALPADGYFTYVDVAWHEFTGDTKDGSAWGFNPTGVSTEASGVVWSVLKYTDDEYVMIFRNKDKEKYTNLKIPMYTENAQYYYYAPYDYRYGDSSRIMSGASLTMYNPALTQVDYNKIKTVVVDYGISGMGQGGFSGLRKVQAIVYPNGLDSASYMFSNDQSLKNFIWCHTDENGAPVRHLSEFPGITSLIDTRGLKTVALGAAFSSASSIENIVIGTPAGYWWTEATFNSTSALKRVWSASQKMPEEGVMDLTAISLVSLQKGMFNVGSSIKTVKLPSTITTISTSFKVTDTDNRWWTILGQSKSIDYICTDSVAQLIAKYVAFVRANPRTANTATGKYADNITVNGKSVLTLIKELGLE